MNTGDEAEPRNERHEAEIDPPPTPEEREYVRRLLEYARQHGSTKLEPNSWTNKAAASDDEARSG